MKVFITFGGGHPSYHMAVNRVVKEARQLNFFDEIHGYTDLDLKKSDFWSHHKSFIETPARGYGCWIWKPYFIKTELDKLKNDDILIYCDAGCMINPQGMPRLLEYIEMLNTNTEGYGMISFQLGYEEYKYTKRAIFEHLNAPESIQNMQQCLGTIQIIKKNTHSMNIINKWYDIATNNYNLIDFNTLSTNESPNFVQNRNDQSILSVLVNIYGSIKLKDETYFPDAWDTDGKPYPFWARRMR